MRWIDNASFAGVDRRKRKPTLRFGERRQEAANTEPPTLGATLRQLQVRASAATAARGVRAFVERTRLAAELSAACGETALAQELTRLADLVAAQPEADWSARLGAALATISDRYAQAG